MKRNCILSLTGVLLVPAFLFAVPAKKAPPAGKPAAATVAEAKAFLDEAETKLLALSIDAGRAQLGPVHLHHRRHRDPGRAGQRAR